MEVFHPNDAVKYEETMEGKCHEFLLFGDRKEF